MKDLKIRASAIGKIMHFDKGTTITVKQLDTITDLEGRDKALTPNQQQTLDDLIAKRDAPPQLSTGAKTYIRDVYYGKKFDFTKRFTNKFTQKGNEMENAAIKEIVDFLGLPMAFKNEKYHENDWTHGTPDVDMSAIDFQFDVKNAYYPNTLGVFEPVIDHDYLWQQRSYCWLLGIKNAAVVRILKNPPEHLIEKEAWVYLKDAGLTQMTDSFVDDVRELFNFEKRPIEDRIKIYTLKCEDEHIDQMKSAVELARVYWVELDEIWKTKNEQEILTIRNLGI
ncbi:MAG: hypothetical protein ACI9N9_000069 [Enterobacterales bacterium]|jgi:hypothetical protein